MSLRDNQKEQIIDGAEKARMFVPPIIDKTEIHGDLEKGIKLVQMFIAILPSARSVKNYENSYDSRFDNIAFHVSHGEHFLKNTAEIHSFIKKISSSLPFLSEFLSNPDNGKKLQYYFINEEKLLSYLERFVKTDGSYKALLSAC